MPHRSWPEGKNAPDAALLLKLSQYDSALIADEYGLKFPEAVILRARGRKSGKCIVSNVPQADLPRLMATVGDALWSGDEAALATLLMSMVVLHRGYRGAVECSHGLARTAETLFRCYVPL